MVTQCQQCKKLLNIPDSYEGKEIKCPACKQLFQAYPEIEKEPVKQTEQPTKPTLQSIVMAKANCAPSVEQNARPLQPGITWMVVGGIVGFLSFFLTLLIEAGKEVNELVLLIAFLTGISIGFCFYTVGFIINQLERIAFYAEKNRLQKMEKRIDAPESFRFEKRKEDNQTAGRPGTSDTEATRDLASQEKRYFPDL